MHDYESAMHAAKAAYALEATPQRLAHVVRPLLKLAHREMQMAAAAAETHTTTVVVIEIDAGPAAGGNGGDGIVGNGIDSAEGDASESAAPTAVDINGDGNRDGNGNGDGDGGGVVPATTYASMLRHFERLFDVKALRPEIIGRCSDTDGFAFEGFLSVRGNVRAITFTLLHTITHLYSLQRRCSPMRAPATTCTLHCERWTPCCTSKRRWPTTSVCIAIVCVDLLSVASLFFCCTSKLWSPKTSICRAKHSFVCVVFASNLLALI
jgi:hypothetical protein